jgi:hypothetical protein
LKVDLWGEDEEKYFQIRFYFGICKLYRGKDATVLVEV